MQKDYEIIFNHYKEKHQQYCDAILKAHTTDSEDEAWHTRRSMGIGGSELGTVMGLNQYQTAHQLWMTKTGRAEPFKGNKYTHFGHVLEDVVAQEFSRLTDMPVQVCSTHFKHKTLPFLVGNVDRIIMTTDADGKKHRSAILECKTAQSFMASKFSKDAAWYIDEEFKHDKVYVTNLHDIPPAYYIQCQHYMNITGLHECYLAALIGGSDYHIYCIKYSEADVSIMESMATRFWCLNILDDAEPTAQPTDLWLPYMEGDDVKVVESGDNVYRLISDYQHICEMEKNIKAQKNMISDKLVAEIGTANMLTDSAGNKLATLKAGSRATVDIELMKKTDAELVERYQALAEKCTIKKQNSKRTLKVY